MTVFMTVLKKNKLDFINETKYLGKVNGGESGIRTLKSETP
jgi:hypothetical protein